MFSEPGPQTGAVGFEPVQETVALFPEKKTFPWEEEDTDKTRPLDFDVAALLAAPRAAPDAALVGEHVGESRAEPAAAPGAEWPAAQPARAEIDDSTTLCRVCLSPFQYVPGSSVNLCDGCGGGPEPESEGVGPLFGGALPYPTRAGGQVRLDPVVTAAPPRAKLRSGVVALLAGVLVAGSAGVVTLLEPEADPFVDALVDVRPANAVLRVMVPGKKSYEFETHSDLRIIYETAAGGSSDLRQRLDVLLDTVSNTEMALIERRSAGDLVRAASTSRADVQVVRVAGGREVNRDVYPWNGYEDDMRIYLPPKGEPTIAGGGFPLPGRDLPPLLNLAVTGTGPRDVEPGDEWACTVPLPLLSDREGRVAVHGFDARFVYAGREAAHGYECLVVRMRAYVAKPLPPSLRRMDQVRGVVHGLLHYDSRTGLLVHGDLRSDLVLSRTKGGGGERLKIAGRVTVVRP